MSSTRSPLDFGRQHKLRMECRYFESFRDNEPDVQKGVVKHCDKPDFRVTLGNRVIGVEVTRVFKRRAKQVKCDGRRTEQDIESTQDRILEAACEKAQKLGLPSAHVTLFFSLRDSLNSAARERIADSVVDVIAEHMPNQGGSIELEMRPGQPSEVDLITVKRVHSRARWEWLEAHAIERNVIDRVQAAITEKSELLESYLERLETYRKPYTECWLLLVADSSRSSGNLAFDDPFHTFMSPFERTYFLDFGRGKLHRLKTE